MRAPTDVTPSGDARAWADPTTRRALGTYGLKACACAAVALVCFALGALTLDENGDTVAGVPEFVSLALLIPAVLLPCVAVYSLGLLGLMTAAALRHPWRTFDSSYELLPLGRNGQPLLTLDAGDGVRSQLTPSALVWRWKRFGSEPTLLFASGSNHWGLIATPDRRHVAWAGQSPVTEWYLRRREDREHRGHD